MKLNQKEADVVVSVLNALVEKFCEKHPEEFEFDNLSFVYDEKGEVKTYNGDDVVESMEWVLNEVIPDVLN